MKLFTIGDSVSQGFMSGAAARTDLAYSTLIARSMKLADYRYPKLWGAGGLPLNLENVLRQLQQKYGTDISGFDWLSVIQTLGKIIDGVEDYYERGKGAENQPDLSGVEFYHNVAIQGFDVADAWLVKPETCKTEIKNSQNEKQDNTFGFPSATFYRTALKVLNPSLKPQFDQYTQLEWLRHHATQEGVENLLLWLGSNNALGTVLGLNINQTPGAGSRSLLSLSREQREAWNLWHPNDFAVEYAELLDRVDLIMQQNRNQNFNVFVGTVPLVTIAPLAKGFGETMKIEVDTDFGDRRESYIYYKYYSYFFREEEAVQKGKQAFLTLNDALHIDNCIRQYNQTIKKLVAQKNQNYPQPRYHIVDLSKALQDIAFKRNAGQVKYQFPDYFTFKYPPVNTKYYHADQQGRLKQGGLFSLDGVHPSAIGQGLIAYEFLKVMQKVGVVSQINLDWEAIFKSDQLYSDPISLMHEFYENDRLAEFLIGWIAGKPAARTESFHLKAMAEDKVP
jgi:hypothetical protein